MIPHSEVDESIYREPSTASEVLNSDSEEQTESFKGFTLESSAATNHHVGNKFHGMFQFKQGYCADLPAVRMTEVMKLSSAENVSTKALFTFMNKILDEKIEQKNVDISHYVASLLKVVLQEIEQRITVQAENFKKQNYLCKAREEKYQSVSRVLEILATGTTEEYEVVMNQLQQIKIEKVKTEERNRLEEQNAARLLKEKDQNDSQILVLKQELELAKRTYDNHSLQLQTQAKETKVELENKSNELEWLLTDSRKKVKELEAFSESNFLKWKQKELNYKGFMDLQTGYLQDLRVASESIKQEVLQMQSIYLEQFNCLGMELNELVDAAENYHLVLAENRKLYNEVQDLKGNIRVYCRIRPFLPGENVKQTTIEYVGDNGELVVVNPSKQGKHNHRLFKFSKVFAPAATQEKVFLDTQPLIRSVLDGYNVCIFAYGQTGSGKTYTMTGPNISSKEDWGVNYRALNDLFHLSQSRKSSITYEVGVQMIEIYNEQVRDLLNNDASQKRLGIWNTSQPNGLVVPEASMYPVKSTADVLELMDIGLMNRAVGATALNERSSRSHSVLTVHVCGTDLATDAVLRGNLHLVDLAGSERVDRSEATGDRLREAQHINKSLSALGDVIFALAQKSPHVPYRNSKLTQVLQSSLGGQAKTLMFVQLNPDVESYSETISTLKFAERVSGVELGAARSNKEGRGVRELLEQVTSLKDEVAKKDEEIGRLRLVKSSVNGETRDMSSLRLGSSSPRRHSASQQLRTPSRKKSPGLTEKAASDLDNSSEYSDKQSEAGSEQSVDYCRNRKEFFQQSRHAMVDGGQNRTEDIELVGFGTVDSEERLSDICDSGLSMGTETDGSKSSIVEYTLFPETSKSPLEKSNVPTKTPKPAQRQLPTKPPLLSSNKTLKGSSSSKRNTASSSSSVKPVKRAH